MKLVVSQEEWWQKFLKFYLSVDKEYYKGSILVWEVRAQGFFRYAFKASLIK